MGACVVPIASAPTVGGRNSWGKHELLCSSAAWRVHVARGKGNEVGRRRGRRCAELSSRALMNALLFRCLKVEDRLPQGAGRAMSREIWKREVRKRVWDVEWVVVAERNRCFAQVAFLPAIRQQLTDEDGFAEVFRAHCPVLSISPSVHTPATRLDLSHVAHTASLRCV